MDKPEPDYGSDELLLALTEQLERHDDSEGMTTEQIARVLGVNIHKARAMLRAIFKQGRLRSETVYRETYDGTRRPTKLYSINPPD